MGTAPLTMAQWKHRPSHLQVPARLSYPHGDPQRQGLSRKLTPSSSRLPQQASKILVLLKTAQYSHLYRGVYPFMFPEKKPDFSETVWQEDVDRRLKWGIEQAVRLGVLNKGDNVVCVQGWKGGMGHTNTIRIVPAEEDLGLAKV